MSLMVVVAGVVLFAPGAGVAADPGDTDPREVLRKAADRLAGLEPKHEILDGVSKVKPKIELDKEKRVKTATFVFDTNAVPPGKGPAKAKDDSKPFCWVSLHLWSGPSQQPPGNARNFRWKGESYTVWVQVYGSDAELVKVVRKALEEP
jgi:hypothetical protein